MSLRVFVAAPFEARLRVRAIHAALLERGLTPTAHWCDAEPTTPPEIGKSVSDWFETLPAEEIDRIIKQNDNDLVSSHVLLMVAQDVGGRESYAEVARALIRGIPVVWTGPTRVLSAYRHGVRRVPSMSDAIRLLEDVQVQLNRSLERHPVSDGVTRAAMERRTVMGLICHTHAQDSEVA